MACKNTKISHENAMISLDLTDSIALYMQSYVEHRCNGPSMSIDCIIERRPCEKNKSFRSWQVLRRTMDYEWRKKLNVKRWIFFSAIWLYLYTSWFHRHVTFILFLSEFLVVWRHQYRNVLICCYVNSFETGWLVSSIWGEPVYSARLLKLRFDFDHVYSIESESVTLFGKSSFLISE